MKKLTMLLITLALILTFAACGENSTSKSTNTASAVANSVQDTNETVSSELDSAIEEEEETVLDEEEIIIPEEVIDTEDEETNFEPEKEEVVAPEEKPALPEKNTAPVEKEEETVHTHSYTSKVTKTATCGAEGVKTFSCSCGDSYTETIAATGNHSYSSKVTKAATCGTAGVKTFTCSCGKSYTESIAATGHSWGSWKTTKAATALAKGTSERKCNNCSKKETKDIAQLNNYFHNETITGRDNVNAPYFVLAREAYFQADGSFMLRTYILNATSSRVSGLDIVKLNVYDANGKLICTDTFQDQNFIIDGKCYLRHTFVMSSKAVSSYNVDLSNVIVHCVYDF